MQIIFEYGKTRSFGELPENSIALDGAVQGPQMDPATLRWSFDHHGGCIRLVTASTCEQVRTALMLGLYVDSDTKVYVNDIDADTVLAVWALKNRNRLSEPVVKQLFEMVGAVDAHGPFFEQHPMHRHLTPARGVEQDFGMLVHLLFLVDDFVDGRFSPSLSADQGAESGSMVFDYSRGWQQGPLTRGFKPLYDSGYVAAVLFDLLDDGTYRYTLAKASDLVPIRIGPIGHPDGTLLGKLAVGERQKNPHQPPESNWGGGSSIGGSPRNADRSSSRLNPHEVLQILRAE